KPQLWNECQETYEDFIGEALWVLGFRVGKCRGMLCEKEQLVVFSQQYFENMPFYTNSGILGPDCVGLAS
ncbi:MAG: hypothetical protein Q7U74_11820, partial [Saprospiraceae bacterium]|nr:hypothetical protein [Saprospiraceae bacterium]